jgi:hypothetical protein
LLPNNSNVDLFVMINFTLLPGGEHRPNCLRDATLTEYALEENFQLKLET